MMAEVPDSRPLLMLAIARRGAPDKLERQERKQEEDEAATHGIGSYQAARQTTLSGASSQVMPAVATSIWMVECPIEKCSRNSAAISFRLASPG